MAAACSASRERGVPECGGQGACKETPAEGRRGGVGLDAAGTFLGVSRPEGPWRRPGRVFVGSLPGLTPARHPHPADSPRGRGSRLALQDERRIERRCVTATRDGSGAAHPARPPRGPPREGGGERELRARGAHPGAPQRVETPPESQPARRLIFHLPTLSSFYSQMTFSIKKCKFPQETFVVSFLTSHPSLMPISS